jgi:hypothetical protein
MSDADAAGPLGFKPTLTDHPVDVGLRSEAAILGALVKRGYAVLLPFGVNQRYDMVLDLEGRFVRAQCKTGRLRRGGVEFSTKSVWVNSQGAHWRGYAGEADVFLVYCPDLDTVYLVPLEVTPISSMLLRIDSTLNRQSRRVHWAADYLLPG